MSMQKPKSCGGKQREWKKIRNAKMYKNLKFNCDRAKLVEICESEEVGQLFNGAGEERLQKVSFADGFELEFDVELNAFQDVILIECSSTSISARSIEVGMAESKNHIAAYLMKVLTNIWSGGCKNSKFPEVEGLFEIYEKANIASAKKSHAEKLLKSGQIFPLKSTESSCEYCGKVIKENASKNAKYKHIARKHTEMLPKSAQVRYVPKTKLRCEICEKHLSSQIYLEIHHRTKHTSYTCSTCDETVIGAAAFAKHKLKHAKKSIKKECIRCKKLFSSDSSLRNHFRAFHGSESERHYKCKHCARSFSERAKLKSHFLQNHSDLRPYVCRFENCSSDFKSSSNLYSHERKIHSKDFGAYMSINHIVPDHLHS